MPGTPESKPRIGLTFPGDPRALTTWSGTPAGLSAGLRACGADVSGYGLKPAPTVQKAILGVSALPRLRPAPEGWRTAVRTAAAHARVAPTQGRVESFNARRKLRDADFDAVVQVGTGYALPPRWPVVTFEDMTVPLARQLGFAGFRDLSPAALRARQDAQKRAYQQAVACCATSAWAAESIVADYGIAREKVHIVGIGANHVAPLVDRDWSVPRFLFLGTDWQGKNGDAILRAFAAVREDHPNARLDVAGDHPRLDVPGVEGHGWLRIDDDQDRARIERLFQNATCFVMPSHREAMGIVFAEAAAAGIASIGTTAGGGSQIIGAAGRVVDPDSDAQLLDAMRELADPDRARELGALAQTRSVLFTWRAVAERILRALDLPAVDTHGLADFLEPVAHAHR
jgi:glycosyltransferase involved in cell wall biosynthesis